ncbi:hypothetical protein D3C75_858050 [compost metagenome]
MNQMIHAAFQQPEIPIRHGAALFQPPDPFLADHLQNHLHSALHALGHEHQQDKREDQKKNGDPRECGNTGKLVQRRSPVRNFGLCYPGHQLPPGRADCGIHYVHCFAAVLALQNALLREPDRIQQLCWQHCGFRV